MQDLAGRHLVLVLTGGVACYKSAELCRQLVQAGATVQVVMSEAARAFIGAATLQALSGRPVVDSMWDAREPNGMAHINLSRGCDAIVVAPASADFIARLAQGRADDLSALLALARPRERVPLVLAPAMNRQMWQHPATRRNLAQAVADGAVSLGVGCGEQACGETGDGRMLEPQEIVEELVALLAPKPLAGRRVLVTAGPTWEALDPVRGITNRSSGRMGFAIARAAREAGAAVTLVAGPVHLPTPRGVDRIDVTSARDMLAAVLPQAEAADLFIATAAVADWRPVEVAAAKVKKGDGGVPVLPALVENPDILATVAAGARARAGRLFCVGFAAETHDLLAHAETKRRRKGVPLLAANIGPDTFGRDDNELLLLDEGGEHRLPRAPKLHLARQLIAHIAQRLPPP